MDKHTPGPWMAHFEEAFYVTGPDRGGVAMMLNLKGAYGLGGRRTGEESAANARLIAAAPELLKVDVWLVFRKDGTFLTNFTSQPDASLRASSDYHVIPHTLEGELPNV